MLNKIFISIIIILLIQIGTAIASIDNLTVDTIKINSSEIWWDTTQFGTSQIEYGTTTSYGSITGEDDFAYFHRQELNGLLSSTLYHYRVKTKDYNNVATYSSDATFTTRNQTQLDDVIKAARLDGQLSKIYYVSNSTGNNENNGTTTNSAWKTLSNASSRLDAGDILYLMNDTWYNDILGSFNRSGIDVAPITITAYPGAHPIMQGTYPGSGNCPSTCNTTYYGIKANSKNYLEISDIESFDYYTAAGINSGSNNTLSNMYIHDTKGQGIHGSSGSRWNTIINNTLINVGSDLNERDNGIQITGKKIDNADPVAMYITIKNNTIDRVADHNGIDLYGDLEYINIDGNKITNMSTIGIGNPHDVDLDYEAYLTIKNNYIHHYNGQEGIILYNTHNSLVYNNTLQTVTSTVNGLSVRYYTNTDTIWTVRNKLYSSDPMRAQSGTGGYYFIDNNDDSNDIQIRSGTSATFINSSTNFKLVASGNNTATIQFDDNTVFKTPSITGTYTISEPITYKNNRSYMVLTETSASDVVITFPIKYNMNVQPSQNSITITNSSGMLNLSYLSTAIPRTNITFGTGISKKINLDSLTGTNYTLEYASNGTDIETKVSSSNIVNFTTTLGIGSYNILEDNSGASVNASTDVFDVWIDEIDQGVDTANLSINVTGLSPNTPHNISIRGYNTTYGTYSDWVNQTTRTNIVESASFTKTSWIWWE